MFCAPSCQLPISGPLRLLNCEALTEPILQCRRFSPHWQSEERRWCLRNGHVLRQLANILQKPLTLVCSFLFQLTLQKFGRILNPKCSHWTWCRVPFVRPDTCAFYDGIFDLQGNLRNPLHPFILHLVVAILTHFLNIPCEGNKKLRKKIGNRIFEGRGGSCKDFFNADMTSQASSLRQFLDESTFGFGGNNLDGDDKSGSKNKDDDLVIEGRRDNERKSINNISDLYSDVVENKHTRDLLKGRRKKHKKRRPKYGNRQYMGVMLPVLVHEPFDDTKPWTWIRRHPVQTRVLEGTQFGRAKVHRYKRATLEQQYQRAKQRFSVRSVYSVGSHTSVVSVDIFGRKDRPQRGVSMVKAFNYNKLMDKNEERSSNLSAGKLVKTQPKPKRKPAK